MTNTLQECGWWCQLIGLWLSFVGAYLITTGRLPFVHDGVPAHRAVSPRGAWGIRLLTGGFFLQTVGFAATR